MIGQVISHYKIIEKLGEGGMGVVYKARDTKLDRTVALKFLPPAVGEKEKTRLIREAQAVARLDHPNICTVYEIGDAEGMPYIAMAYVEGTTIKDRVEEGQLTLDEITDYAQQIARGLQTAHRKNITHRDIKCANIMVTDEGQVKIMDFGLAKLAGRTQLTKEGTTAGTVAYMSPEQARGEDVDHRTDIWSFGVVLYELLTGQLPFRSEYETAMVYSILNEDPTPVSNINPDIPAELEAIVLKALEKNKEDRYQSIEELLADLDALTGKPARRYGLRRAVTRNSAYLYASIILFLVLVGAAILFLWSPVADVPAFESIAVLPFENLSGDPEQDYLVEGMHDALITDLARLSGLKRVIARPSVMRYRGTDKQLSEIAQELTVDVLVTGAVVRVGDRIRVTAQLINPVTEDFIWADRYDRDFRDILNLQNEIISSVAGQIALKLTPEEVTYLAEVRPVNPEAHEAYLKGVFHWHRLTPTDLETALEYFELTLSRDTDYAPAYSGIARVWLGRQQMGYASPHEATSKAIAAATRAIELDGELAEARYVLAAVRTWGEWDWQSADREFRIAIDINPNYAEARAFYSHLLQFLGRPEEALLHIQQAVVLDPFNPMYQALYGINLNFVRRYEDAIVQLQNALRTAPGLPFAYTGLAVAFHEKGIYDEALEAMSGAFTAIGDIETANILDLGYREDGYTGAMRKAAEHLTERSRTMFVPPVRVAHLYANAGEIDLQIEWLNKAFEVRDPELPYITQPVFDNLRDDPRFQELMRKMNFPE